MSSRPFVRLLALVVAGALGLFIYNATSANEHDIAKSVATEWLHLPCTSPAPVPEAPLSPIKDFAEHHGLLILRSLPSNNSKAPLVHPILHLIQQAKEEWKAKVAKQSKSLQAAVGEYRRRYSRNPPKGFDDWFVSLYCFRILPYRLCRYRFATENKVVLIDEYDQIDRDVTPFLAFNHKVMQGRSNTLMYDEDNYWHGGSFTLQIRDGEVKTVIGPQAEHHRANSQADLMLPFVQWLPDMNATFWLHDTPILHTSGRLKLVSCDV